MTPVYQADERMFRISIGPLLALYGWIFAILYGLLIAITVLVMDGPWPAGLITTMVWWLLVLGTGVFILSVFSYVSGPDVYVGEEGIRIHAAWLADKGYVEKRHFSMRWEDMSYPEPWRFFTMPYLKIYSRQKDEPLPVPVFLQDKAGFWEAVNAYAPADHPLRAYYREEAAQYFEV